MKIQFTTLKHTKNFSNLNFGTKKVLFTDFDNTYFPFVRSDINPINAQYFKSMYLPFVEYKKDQNDDFKLVITTGRSKNDYLHTQGLIEQNGLDFCKPDALISSNGANVFVFKNNTVNNVFPYDDENAQSTLENILALIAEHDRDISIVECGINGDEKTYQDLSSESKLDKLTNKDKYISYVKDGKYNAEIVVSKNIDFDTITSLVKQYIQENNLPYSVESYHDAKYTPGFEYKDGVKQEVQANVIFLKYAPNGVQPDKFDLIMKKVREIENTGTDELIIVAGDGFNDAKMLNPLNYIEGDKDIENPSTLLKLSKLPLRSIICSDDGCLDELRELAQKLSEKGIDIIKLAPDSKTDFIKVIREFDKQKNNRP